MFSCRSGETGVEGVSSSIPPLGYRVGANVLPWSRSMKAKECFTFAAQKQGRIV